MMKPICFFLLLLFFPPPAPAEDLQADLKVDLDKKDFTQAEDVSGTITITLRWTKDSLRRDKPTVLMNGPQVSLQVEPSLRCHWGPIIQEFTPFLENPVKIGQAYALRFKIAAGPTLRGSLGVSGKHVASFTAGTYSLRAKVASPWSHSGLTPEPESHCEFISERKEVAVTPEPGKIVSKEDLLVALEKAGPIAKSYLVCYYESMGQPLRDLKCFEKPKQPHSIAHEAAPLFLEVRPGEEVRFMTKPPAKDISRAGCVINDEAGSFSALNNPEIMLRAPKEEGLYKLTCNIHHDKSGPLGWLLVLQR